VSSRETRLTAHRGTVGRYPENTIPAFLTAAYYGAHAVETDLRLTSDGRWMLMHDPTVDRTTDGHGAIADLTTAQVRQLRTAGGYRVHSLTGMLNGLTGYPNLRYQLEVKPVSPTKQSLKRLVTVLRECGVQGRVLFTSSDIDVLRGLKELAPEISVGWIPLGQATVSPSDVPDFVDFVMAHQVVATTSYVAGMHEAGFKVSARSANCADDWGRLLSNSIDNVVTDDVKGYESWYSSVGQ
jgi:glycerophosphoryl diester phosphodiesterase